MSLERIKYELKNNYDVTALEMDAQKGDVTAQVYLGICYVSGIKRPKNLMEGIRLFKLAVESGNALAEFCLGSCYVFEPNLKDHRIKGFDLLYSAAKKGNGDALVILGMSYFRGLPDVPKDIRKAVIFLKVSSTQNNLQAKNVLGYIYMAGCDGFPKDEMKGFGLIKSAAEQGDPLAMRQVGLCYDEGFKELPSNPQEASKWYSLAIQNGYTNAIRDLYTLFEKNDANPEIIYRTAKLCAAPKAIKALSMLAIQKPNIFNELAVADSLSDLKSMLSPECLAIVEKRRKEYALSIKNKLSSTPIVQAIYPEIISYLLPSSDVSLFFKRQSQRSDKNQADESHVSHGCNDVKDSNVSSTSGSVNFASIRG